MASLSLQLQRPGQLFQRPAPAMQVLPAVRQMPSLLSPQALVSQFRQPALPSPAPVSTPLDRFQRISGMLSQRGIPATVPQAQTSFQAPTQSVPSQVFSTSPQLFSAPQAGQQALINNPPIPRARPLHSPAEPVQSSLAPLISQRPQARPADLAPALSATRPAPTRKPLKDDYTYQFGEIGKNGGTRKEAQANCGPASSAMILKAYGIQPPSMHALRSLVGAPTGSRSGPYALDSQQVGKAVVRTAAKQGLDLDFSVKRLSTNVDRTLADMRKGLERGDKLILLSSGLRSLSQGHYMVIKEIRSDGSVVMNDSGRRDGKDFVYSKNRLAQALSKRVNTYRRENQLISFREA